MARYLCDIDWDDRACAICGSQIPSAEGLYYAPYNILVHGHGSFCHARIRLVQKDYSRSTRGRWRSKSEAMRLLGKLGAEDVGVLQSVS